jgi:hypothetical protein
MAITKVTRTLLSTGIVDNSNATAITIDSSENVGIGTASPTAKLHIANDSGIRVNNSASTQQFDLKAQGSNLGIENFFGKRLNNNFWNKCKWRRCYRTIDATLGTDPNEFTNS